MSIYNVNDMKTGNIQGLWKNKTKISFEEVNIRTTVYMKIADFIKKISYWSD